MTLQRCVFSRVLVLSAVVVLGGCGGGDDGNVVEEPTNTVPASATASVGAFVGFVGGLAPADHAEPLRLDGMVAPTSDADEPTGLT